ncbi:ATP-dependent Clp protease ATP-binding subunit ClpX [Novimethylophilus kurashikiensis]|uniref:ATP-dependent Clp protease ATP-binding subunit ClpX n=2 Tax=Novimethylophilus kurashikiensis TaxID=1825523 RepID=A0A2R5F9A3_9PROT|nr:ATP-dependent Clp protease ATP-binding subunit ClpX [Novimethylophilus kurashikiensis]
MSQAENNHNCVHCGTSPEAAASMLQLQNGSNLCGACIALANEMLVMGQKEKEEAIPEGRKTPKEIVAFLNDYVIGQEAAKKAIAIAVYNHYKRLSNPTDVEISKSNILMLGPTGTGKTLLAQSIARLLDVPFTIADATSLTQAGYVGDDVETILQRLLQAADGDIAKAERGIVFIDEVDKLRSASTGPSVTRDVSGEGVQQSLLKLIEGTKVRVPVAGGRKHPGAQAEFIDTTNILFVCSGAFVSVLESLEEPKEVRSMGFFSQAPDAKGVKTVTPDLLVEHGMIPEFIGRLPVVVTLEQLNVDALERILVEPKNAVVRQMEALFDMDGAKLNFEAGAVRAIAEKAYELKTGARGARSILEDLLKDALYEVPGEEGATVQVSADLKVTVDYPQLKLAA